MKTDPIFCQITSGFYDTWNSFVDASPQGFVFCYSWWLDSITKGNYKILAVFENEQIVAGIPLAYYFGKINEPPLTRTLGPLFKDLGHLPEHDRITIQRNWLNLLLDQIPFDEFEQFSTSHNFNDWLPFRWRGYKQTTRYTYLIDYEGKSEDDLWKQLSENRRRNIKKAIASQIKVEISDDFELFYHLVELTYQRQGLSFTFSFDDYKALDEAILKNRQRIIFTAFDGQKQAHASMYVVYNQRFCYFLLSGSDPKFRDQGAETLLMWEALKHFRDKTRYFNFGGSDIQRIESHIRGFGGQLVQYFHIFAERPVTHDIEKEIVREVTVLPPSPPDDWKYHVALIGRHTWVLVKKLLYKLHVRFNLPVKVSVVVSCQNSGKEFMEMIQSVLSQTFPFFEIIVVNDGLNDDKTIVLKTIRHTKVRILYAANHGPAHARNLAIIHAKGDLIVAMGAGDTLAPDFLRRCVEIMDKYRDAGLVFSNTVFWRDKNESVNGGDCSFENLLRANCSCSTACFRKFDWEKTEGFPVLLQPGFEVSDFWLSILELGREVRKIEEPLVFVRKQKNPVEGISEMPENDNKLTETSVLQVFRRHFNLYKKSPEVLAEFLEMEKRRNSGGNELPIYDVRPVFSIITPTNNRPGLLKRNIDSVQKQSFTSWEHIIVDDANSAETRRLVQSLNDHRIKYFAHDCHKGASGAYNTGMMNASGKFFNFLDDDDEYTPDMLQKVKLAFDQATNDPGFVWTGISNVRDTENGEELINTQVWPSDFESRDQGLMVSTAIGNGFGLSVRCECLKKAGFYDESLKVGVDTDFLMNLSQYYQFKTVPEVLVKIHHHVQGQLTHNKNDGVRCDSYQKIIRRHQAFLSKHWDAYYVHNKAFVNLCFRINRRHTGRKALWRLVAAFPGRRIAWLDLFCWSFRGKSYQDCEIGKTVKVLKNKTKVRFSL